MTKPKPNWTHVQREVIKCVQTREFLEIMAAGMFWQNTKGHKILSRKKGGKKLPCYPSLTFFCPRWFCLASTSYQILIGRNFWRSHALKRSGSFGEHKRQLLLSGIMICGSCGLLHMEIFLLNSLGRFQQTACDWSLGRGQGRIYTVHTVL